MNSLNIEKYIKSFIAIKIVEIFDEALIDKLFFQDELGFDENISINGYTDLKNNFIVVSEDYSIDLAFNNKDLNANLLLGNTIEGQKLNKLSEIAIILGILNDETSVNFLKVNIKNNIIITNLKNAFCNNDNNIVSSFVLPYKNYSIFNEVSLYEQISKFKDFYYKIGAGKLLIQKLNEDEIFKKLRQKNEKLTEGCIELAQNRIEKIKNHFANRIAILSDPYGQDIIETCENLQFLILETEINPALSNGLDLKSKNTYFDIKIPNPDEYLFILKCAGEKFDANNLKYIFKLKELIKKVFSVSSIFVDVSSILIDDNIIFIRKDHIKNFIDKISEEREKQKLLVKENFKNFYISKDLSLVINSDILSNNIKIGKEENDKLIEVLLVNNKMSTKTVLDVVEYISKNNNISNKFRKFLIKQKNLDEVILKIKKNKEYTNFLKNENYMDLIIESKDLNAKMIILNDMISLRKKIFVSNDIYVSNLLTQLMSTLIKYVNDNLILSFLQQEKENKNLFDEKRSNLFYIIFCTIRNYPKMLSNKFLSFILSLNRTKEIFKEFGNSYFAVEIFDSIVSNEPEYITSENVISLFYGTNIKIKDISHVIEQLFTKRGFLLKTIWKEFTMFDRNKIYNFFIKNPEKANATIIYNLIKGANDTNSMSKTAVAKFIGIFNMKNSIKFYEELASYGIFCSMELIYSLLKSLKNGNKNISANEIKNVLNIVILNTKLDRDTKEYLTDLIATISIPIEKKIEKNEKTDVNPSSYKVENDLKSISSISEKNNIMKEKVKENTEFQNIDEYEQSETEKLHIYYANIKEFGVQKFAEDFNSLKDNHSKIELLIVLLKNPNIKYKDLMEFRELIKSINDPRVKELFKKKVDATFSDR